MLTDLMLRGSIQHLRPAFIYTGATRRAPLTTQCHDVIARSRAVRIGAEPLVVPFHTGIVFSAGQMVCVHRSKVSGVNIRGYPFNA